MRESLTIIIVLLILAILLDGLRRMRRARRESLRMSRNVRKRDGEDFADPNNEVCSEPRVVRQRDVNDAQSITKTMRESFAKSRLTVGAPRRIPEQVSLNLQESVPMLMDSLDDNAEQQPDYTQAPSWAEPRRHAEAAPRSVQASRSAANPSPVDAWDDDEDLSRYDDDAFEQHEDQGQTNYAEAGYAPAFEPDHASAEHGVEGDADYEREHRTEPVMQWSAHDAAEREPELGSLDDLAVEEAPVTRAVDAEPVRKDRRAERQEPRSVDKEQKEPRPDPEEVLIINLMAPAGERFDGAELLQALLDQGLRFGAMNIFHRHKYADGSGPVRFSLANMVVPGTFDLATMADFSTPGVSMFLSLPNEDDSLAAFDCMADTAKALMRILGGELKDENRSVMTRQTLEHCRQRVLEFERKQRLMQRSALTR